MADTAKISIGGKTIDLPILKGTTGPDVVDIRKYYAESDTFTRACSVGSRTVRMK